MKECPTSPVNGQPTPPGRPFTRESAREARRKRTKKEQDRRSIAKAFIARMGDTFHDSKTGKDMTGAEIIAESIIKGANKGNAKMVEIALALLGEKPAERMEAVFSDADFVLRIVDAAGEDDRDGDG